MDFINTRNRFREDWKASAAASYLSDLVSRSTPRDAPYRGLFHLLETALDDADDQGALDRRAADRQAHGEHLLAIVPRERNMVEDLGQQRRAAGLRLERVPGRKIDLVHAERSDRGGFGAGGEFPVAPRRYTRHFPLASQRTVSLRSYPETALGHFGRHRL